MKTKSIYLFILAILMAVSITPFSAVAAEGETPYIVHTTIPVDAGLKADVDAWLASSAPVPFPYWAITYVGDVDELGDTFVSLVAVDLASPTDDWHVYDD